MEKTIKNKKLQKKLYRMRNQKNCIPEHVAANNPGEYDGVDEYRSSRPNNPHVSIKDRVGKGKKLNKQKPWYYLTKQENIAINARTVSPKMKRDDYITGYLNQKMNKWEKANPKPLETDLFYKEQYPAWIAAREAHHDTIMSFISKKYVKKYTKTVVYDILESKNKESKEAYKKAA